MVRTALRSLVRTAGCPGRRGGGCIVVLATASSTPASVRSRSRSRFRRAAASYTVGRAAELDAGAPGDRDVSDREQTDERRRARPRLVASSRRQVVPTRPTTGSGLVAGVGRQLVPARGRDPSGRLARRAGRRTGRAV